MQDFARPAMSGSVVLVTGSIHTVLKPAILGRHLAIEPDGHGGLAPKLDGAGIRAELDRDALAKLEQAPNRRLVHRLRRPAGPGPGQERRGLRPRGDPERGPAGC